MQLGKLDVSQSAQGDGYKTPDNRTQFDQRVTPRKQNAQPEGKSHDFPIVVAEWDRNKRELVRVALDRYNGHHTVNIRIWYRDGDDLQPSKSGITLGLKHLAPLASALNNAHDLANRLGLMIDGGEQ